MSNFSKLTYTSWSMPKLDGQTHITYSFLNYLPSYYSASDVESNGFKAFTDSMKDGARDVLNMVSDFANITFQEIPQSSGNTGHISFAQADLSSGVAAHAYYGWGTSKFLQTGDIWMNTDYSYNQNIVPGTYGHLTAMHELGHALGLTHSFEVGLSGLENSFQ